MDDIHRPDPRRRDFAMRHRPYASRQIAANPPQPAAAPAPPTPAYPSPAVADSDLTTTPGAPTASLPQETPYSHYTIPPQSAIPPAKKRSLKKPPVKHILSAATILVLVSVAGILLTRPAKTSGFTAAQLAKKSSFGFFYPQPLPAGYSYEPKINTFQDGQAYFMLDKGSKHIVVHEQTATGKNSLSGLTAAKKVESAAGRAVVGFVGGQPAAKLLAGSTLISLNSTGGVPQNDLIKALNSFKATLAR